MPALAPVSCVCGAPRSGQHVLEFSNALALLLTGVDPRMPSRHTSDAYCGRAMAFPPVAAAAAAGTAAATAPSAIAFCARRTSSSSADSSESSFCGTGKGNSRQRRSSSDRVHRLAPRAAVVQGPLCCHLAKEPLRARARVNHTHTWRKSPSQPLASPSSSRCTCTRTRRPRRTRGRPPAPSSCSACCAGRRAAWRPK